MSRLVTILDALTGGRIPLDVYSWHGPVSTSLVINWRGRTFLVLTRSKKCLKATLWTEDPGAN